jgi:hypothetical protein
VACYRVTFTFTFTFTYIHSQSGIRTRVPYTEVSTVRERVAQRHLAVDYQWNASLLQKRRGSESVRVIVCIAQAVPTGSD